MFFLQLNLQFGLTQHLSCLLLMFALTSVMPKKVSEQFMNFHATSLKTFSFTEYNKRVCHTLPESKFVNYNKVEFQVAAINVGESESKYIL